MYVDILHSKSNEKIKWYYMIINRDFQKDNMTDSEYFTQYFKELLDENKEIVRNHEKNKNYNIQYYIAHATTILLRRRMDPKIINNISSVLIEIVDTSETTAESASTFIGKNLRWKKILASKGNGMYEAWCNDNSVFNCQVSIKDKHKFWSTVKIEKMNLESAIELLNFFMFSILSLGDILSKDEMTNCRALYYNHLSGIINDKFELNKNGELKECTADDIIKGSKGKKPTLNNEPFPDMFSAIVKLSKIILNRVNDTNVISIEPRLSINSIIL
jgi:hypothetical protein